MTKQQWEPVFVKYDAETRKWFDKHPDAQTTAMCCEKCGLWYKPILGHKCKNRQISMVYSKILPYMCGEFVKWLNDEEFIVLVHGKELIGHKDFWEGDFK